MKASELVHDFQNLRSGGNPSRTNELNEREILFIVDSYRAQLIDQDIKRNNKLSPLLQQDINPLKVECKEGVYISTSKFPHFIQLDYVGGTCGKTPYQWTTISKASWERYSRFTANQPKVYFQDNYLHFINTEAKNHRTIGIFENPLEANKFKLVNAGYNVFNELDFEYPMPLRYRDTIFKMMADAEFKVLGMVPKDTTNDSKDN